MRGVSFILISILLSATRVASASVLATSPQIPFEFEVDAYSKLDYPSAVGFRLCYMDGNPQSGILSPRIDTMIFKAAPLSSPTQPGVSTATATGPQAFAALITDGQTEWLSGQPVFYNSWSDAGIPGPSTIFSESWLLSPRITDFVGYTLTAVTVTTYIDDITPFPPYPLPSTPFHIKGHSILTFEGTPIPEPTSLFTLAASLAPLNRLRRRQ